MQVSASDFIAIIIALASGCVIAIGIAWRCYRELRDCQILLNKATEELQLATTELAALNVAVNRIKASKSDGLNEPINYPPSRYVA